MRGETTKIALGLARYFESPGCLVHASHCRSEIGVRIVQETPPNLIQRRGSAQPIVSPTRVGRSPVLGRQWFVVERGRVERGRERIVGVLRFTTDR